MSEKREQCNNERYCGKAIANGETKVAIRWASFATLTVVIITAGLMVGCPRYEVYRQGQKGKAELRRAESNRQIAIQEANARREAAHALAEAEVIRARGLAEANEIIGASLRDNHEYLHWLFINNLAEASTRNKIIYVPTEAQLPILEAGRATQRTR